MEIHGPGYVSRAFRDYLRLLGIRHILAAPFHPQTNGKLERYHQTIKHEVNQVPYDVPLDLEAAIAGFVRFYRGSAPGDSFRAVPRGPGGRDARRCPQRPPGRHTQAKEGGAGQDHRKPQDLQQVPQGPAITGSLLANVSHFR